MGLLLNDNARNHIKFFPIKISEIPESEADRINWCKNKFELLEQNGKSIYNKKNIKSGFLISVYEMDSYYYIIQSIRNEFKTYNNIIYIHNNKNDSINIAKFLSNNIKEIMKSYKAQVIEAGEDYKKKTLNGVNPSQ